MAASAQDSPGPSATPARTGRPRPSAKGEQTRARLIAAARTLLAGGLAERFTTRNVAALSGVSHGMCHYHFQDRTDLVLAVVTDIRPEWILPLEEAVSAPGSFAERADQVVELLSRPEGAELSHLHSALHWHALNDERVRESLEAEYRRWRGCFVTLFQVLADERDDERDGSRAGAGGVDPLALGEAVAAAVDGLAAAESLGSEVDSGPVLHTLIRTLAAGTRPGA
ncbi:TetR/AcrR family transcriptional regulator [Streptomyces yangpuensis]|uniref:TetR/AcrR family transcriptional regulator n=1 Tax=Streptomyces yangpuensis TaxID=1648182 RepID=A0ABY5PSQ6_9ACTN|nr:TetR/AcrR family transcriptional regulator [Streptomyces yangpuensis]UUY46608.1 TetR/AcrR family transcriptional regulator [Streptomyces yangpuensis]